MPSVAAMNAYNAQFAPALTPGAKFALIGTALLTAVGATIYLLSRPWPTSTFTLAEGQTLPPPDITTGGFALLSASGVTVAVSVDDISNSGNDRTISGTVVKVGGPTKIKVGDHVLFLARDVLLAAPSLAQVMA